MNAPPPGAPPAFFIPEGERFVATESTRGPWSRDHQHGGPPAALLVRAMERLVGDGAHLARLTFDFLRPVPIAPVTVRAEVTRVGARVRRLQAALTAADSTPLVQAAAVAIRTAAVLPESIGDGGPPPPTVEASAPFEFPFFSDPVGYHTAVEARVARGSWGNGPVAAWMRARVPLVAGETASPLQRLLMVADSASGQDARPHGAKSMCPGRIITAAHRTFAAAARAATQGLDHSEHLHPNGDHRQKKRDRGERQRLLDNCANHDLSPFHAEHRANIVH